MPTTPSSTRSCSIVAVELIGHLVTQAHRHTHRPEPGASERVDRVVEPPASDVVEWLHGARLQDRVASVEQHVGGALGELDDGCTVELQIR